MQDELLFSKLRVMDNLRIRSLGLMDETPDLNDRIFRALEQLSISQLADTAVSDLSGGERRRVELAGMFLGDPQAILLDEPTANLDPTNADSVYSALWEIQSGRTVVIVTHEPQVRTAPDSAVDLILANGSLHADA